jgi:N6-adenosine-specific RNA methylase IME4
MSYYPALPGRIRPLGWEVPGRLSKSQWIEAGRILVPLHIASAWWLGDWWAFGDHRYGDRMDIARAEGWPAKTLMNHGSVSRAFPEISRRREVLAWSHHEVVAGLPPPKADQFLDWAEEPLAAGKRVRSTRELIAAVHRSRVTLGEVVSDATCTVSELDELIAKGRKFGCVYADPPWRHPNTATFGAAFLQYETMTIQQIAERPIRELVADDAHLHIWVVPTVWWDVREIVEAWGFNPDPPHPFSWYKEGRIGMGNIWRGQHEIMLSFTRGAARYANDKSIRSILFAEESALRSPRLGHSEKPDEVRELIERVSPAPYLELFGRRPVDGWAVWGNQIAKTDFRAACEAAAD